MIQSTPRVYSHRLAIQATYLANMAEVPGDMHQGAHLRGGLRVGVLYGGLIRTKILHIIKIRSLGVKYVHDPCYCRTG